MEETFDWLSSNTETIKETLDEILDLSFLDVVEGMEYHGQNRESIHTILHKCSKRIKIEVYGFNLNLLDRLLNHVPFYQEGKIKEPISKEMREFIFDRDECTCRLCYSSWRPIYCHHINPQGSANDDNLITLCTQCHEVIHRLLKNKDYPYHIPRGRHPWK